MVLTASAILLIRLWPHGSFSSQTPLSTAVWSADGELLRVTLAADGQYRLWTPFPEISPHLTRAFLLKEDAWFHWHPGVNPVSLGRAALSTVRGQGRQGGSTITMQLARLRYGFSTRHPLGKLRQVAAAVWLELRYSKRDLLDTNRCMVPHFFLSCALARSFSPLVLVSNQSSIFFCDEIDWSMSRAS